jgi:formate dehydrogenase maturation protein FdhE
MKNKIIETINKMSDEEISQLYKYLFGENIATNKIEERFKNRFGGKGTQRIKDICTRYELGFSLVIDFVSYRSKIKKAIRTESPIVIYLNELKRIKDDGMEVLEAIRVMKESEWSTIKKEWLRNVKTKSSFNNSNLSEFGFIKDEKELK